MDEVNIANRFTEERVRLGYSQAAFARMIDVNRATLIKNESGLNAFKSSTFSSAAKLGMDIQYVLTGIHSNNLEQVQQSIGYETQMPTQSVSGEISGVGIANSGANIHIINTPKNITKIDAKTTPGEDHISVEQRQILIELVNKVVEIEGLLKKKPRSHRAVWSALNSHCRVSSYKLIAIEDFEKARKYLHQWLGRLNSSKSAPVKDGDNWRKRHYAYIKINTKDGVDEAAFNAYMQRNFKSSSLRELSNDELERAYKYVAGRRNKRR